MPNSAKVDEIKDLRKLLKQNNEASIEKMKTAESTKKKTPKEIKKKFDGIIQSLLNTPKQKPNKKGKK